MKTTLMYILEFDGTEYSQIKNNSRREFEKELFQDSQNFGSMKLSLCRVFKFCFVLFCLFAQTDSLKGTRGGAN